MREILFRGKLVDNGEWVEGNLFISDLSNETHILVGTRRVTMEFEVLPETVGQYTGLTDKNGTKIFEGDIIRIHGNSKDLSVIEFGPFACVLIEPTEKVDEVVGWHYRPLPTDALSQMEPFCWEFQLNEMWIEENEICVIGNIHDNPELLEVE